MNNEVAIDVFINNGMLERSVAKDIADEMSNSGKELWETLIDFGIISSPEDYLNKYEDEVDEMVATIEKLHLQRLMDSIYPASVGQVYQEFASDTERIADHFLNVAKSIRQLHIGED